MPGAGFVTMALEALYQKHCALLPLEEALKIVPNDLCYRFRNVRFSRAMVLQEGKDVIITFSLTSVPGSKDWHEFRISTTDAEVVSDHCSGLVRIEAPIDEPLEGEDAKPLKSPQAPKLWYKSQREIGMEFGPTFQKLIEVEAVNGVRACRTLISLEPPQGKYSRQSYYPIHPAALDGCLQTVVPSNASCDRTNVKHVMIPSLIDDLVINKVPDRLYRGRSKATSVYGGRGRKDIEKSWVANTSVYDSESNQLVMRITGLNYVKLDVAPKPDPHTFHSVTWRPDITLLTQDQVMYLAPEAVSSKLDMVVDLIAYKKPALKVLEVNLDQADDSSLWFQSENSPPRAAYDQYDFASTNAKMLINVQSQCDEKPNTAFHLLAYDQDSLGLPTKVVYDLLILKASEDVTASMIDDTIGSLKPLLANDVFELVVRPSKRKGFTGPENVSEDAWQDLNEIPVLDVTTTPSDSTSSRLELSANSVSSIERDESATRKAPQSAFPGAATLVFEAGASSDNGLAFLSRPNAVERNPPTYNKLVIVQLSESASQPLPPALRSQLLEARWDITHLTLPFSKLPKDAVVLVLDELWNPVLSSISEKQWEAVRMLTTSPTPVVWVTKGAQGPVTHPDNAMVHGLFRVARQEDDRSNLTTLDVQSSTSAATIWAIAKVLGLIKNKFTVETEYMERDGVIHIQRIMPDAPMNEFRNAEEDGLKPVLKSFHGSEVQVQLRAERLGTLNSLTWCETETEVPALEALQIEVEVMAVGVNFKDVAITMAIVPDDEFNIGFECAGIVKGLGRDVTKFKIGDRVCMLKAGSYANRVRVSGDRCHVIPSSMTFEEAATIPSVYLCSLYAMYHLGNLKEGQVSIQ